MQKARTLALLLVSIACISPAQSQGIMEGTFVRGLGAGMGAGTAASLGHGKVVRRTAESIIQAQQVMIAQTKVIEQYVATGIQLQAKKQWSSAEQYFQDALKMIAKRDGPGSPKSAPVLSRLANVAKNQHKLDEAIGYQKTVVAFANNARSQNPTAAVQAQVDLSGLFIDKGDLANAEGVLKQSVDTVRRDRSIPPKTYSTTLRVYGEVLRKLNKNAEADVVDAELASQGTDAPAAATALQSPAQTVPVQNPDQPAAPAAVPYPETSVSSAAPPETNTASTAVPVPNQTAADSPVASDDAPAQQAASTAAAAVSDSSAPSPAAPAAEAAPALPPGELLPPPTAEWPVMNEDGKIVSESSAGSSAPSTPGASPSSPEAASPADQSKGATEAAPSESKDANK
ncbi:MAG: hypothetical protein K2Y39_00280 [Candidatus Obscuribacterales bacterium]|nr:hypothetical protein [Candidatus Obscuribacterales bacterium]